MSQPIGVTSADLLECCKKNLNPEGRVVLSDAFFSVRMLLRKPILRRTASGLGRRLPKFYGAAWKAAKPKMMHRSWTIALDQAVNLFTAFDSPTRKALGVKKPMAEPVVRPLPTSDDEMDQDEAASDSVEPIAPSDPAAARDKGKQVIREPPATAMEVDEDNSAGAVPDISVGGGGGSSTASDAVSQERQRAEMEQALAERLPIDLTAAGGILTEQQAANVAKNLALVNPFESAYRKSRKSADGSMVVVKDMIGHLYNIDEKQATKKLDKLRNRIKSHPSCNTLGQGSCKKDDLKPHDDDIFRKLPLVTAECTTHATYCKPVDLLRWFIDIDEAKALGLAHYMKNTFIRSLGGDESMIAELQATAKATTGTIIASIARTADVGSSSSAVTHYKPHRQPFAGNHSVYVSLHNGFFKPGKTCDIMDRDSKYSPGIQGLLLIHHPDAAGFADNAERKIFAVLGHLVAFKGEYLDYKRVLQFFGIDIQDPARDEKVTYKILAIAASTLPPGVMYSYYICTPVGFCRLDDNELKEFQQKHELAPFKAAPRKRDADEMFELKRLRITEETARAQHKVEQEEETKRANSKELINVVVQGGNQEMLKLLLEKLQL